MRNLDRCLALVGNCQQAYLESSDSARRLWNQAFFEKILVSEDGTVEGKLAEPFDLLLGQNLRQMTQKGKGQTAKALASLFAKGVNKTTLVELSGHYQNRFPLLEVLMS